MKPSTFCGQDFADLAETKLGSPFDDRFGQDARGHQNRLISHYLRDSEPLKTCWQIAAPAPPKRIATDLAAISICLSSSADLTGGMSAALCSAIPTPDLSTGSRLAADNLPCWMRSSIAAAEGSFRPNSGHRQSTSETCENKAQSWRSRNAGSSALICRNCLIKK